jgi:hypothetical protein
MRSEYMPETLQQLQAAFAGHIRNPAKTPPPAGIEDRRMQVYRELFFNNISSLLAGNFPVLRRLYDTSAWAQLVREFYGEHRAQTPLFPQLPAEFIRYVQEQRQGRVGDPPFLQELAHYEWVELALSLDQTDLTAIDVDRTGSLLEGVPVLSPLAWPLSYKYPVQRISETFRPAEAPVEMTHLLVYRNRTDDVRFMLMNQVSQLLLALLREHPQLTGRQLLVVTAGKIGHPRPAAVIESGGALLYDLLQRDVVLGTVRNA